MWWFIGYLAVAVVLIVPFNRMIMNIDLMSDPELEDRAMAWLFACMMAAFWPTIVVCLVAIRISKAIWNRPKVKP